MKNIVKLFACMLLLSQIVGCAAPAVVPTATASKIVSSTPPPTNTLSPTDTPVPTATSTPRPRTKPGDSLGFIKGVAYIASHIPDWAYPLSDQSMQALRETGAEWISLNAYVTDLDDPKKALEATVHAIQEAHRLGLNVLLRPKFQGTDMQGYHDDLGYSREQWQNWADLYSEQLRAYAQIAEENSVEMFAVGYEMRATEPEEAHWRNIIQMVRAVYSGPITYASLPNEEAGVRWWDAVDFIGVDGYYSLSQKTDPSEMELKSGWVPYLNNLERLSKKYNKPVLFTEIGYPSTSRAAAEPGNWMYGEINLELQARLYKVLFDVIQDKPWITGVFVWAWDETPYQGGPCDFEHTPKGKPAENVMRAFFGAPPVELPGIDPQLPSFDEGQIVTYPLFEDSFYSAMDPNWSWNTQIETAASPEPLGAKSIQVSMTNNAGMVFNFDALDVSAYQWLEFYLYRDDDQSIPLRIMASTSDGTILINRQIRSCWYAEGGVVPPDTWTRILIPLDHLNINNPLQGIALVKWEDGDLKYWIDNVRFVGTGE
jgi:hypothetical protein